MRLEVLDFVGPAKWRFRLTDAGAFLADHDVELDAGEWQFEAFTDLRGYLRWNAAPDRLAVEPALQQMTDNPDLAGLATILRQIVAGEHNPSLEHLDPDQAELVNLVLAQLATQAPDIAEEP